VSKLDLMEKKAGDDSDREDARRDMRTFAYGCALAIGLMTLLGMGIAVVVALERGHGAAPGTVF
jgi:hypothetical protein